MNRKKWAREEIEMVNKYGEDLHLHQKSNTYKFK